MHVGQHGDLGREHVDHWRTRNGVGIRSGQASDALRISAHRLGSSVARVRRSPCRSGAMFASPGAPTTSIERPRLRNFGKSGGKLPIRGKQYREWPIGVLFEPAQKVEQGDWRTSAGRIMADKQDSGLTHGNFQFQLVFRELPRLTDIEAPSPSRAAASFAGPACGTRIGPRRGSLLLGHGRRLEPKTQRTDSSPRLFRVRPRHPQPTSDKAVQVPRGLHGSQ